MLPLRLRWTLRDIKSRWLQVAGIALMIALGTGVSAALSSSTSWRVASSQASYELTNVYDVRANLAGSQVLPRGSLSEIALKVDGVDQVSERLIFETQIEVLKPDGAIFVPSRVIGVDMSNGGPHVNGVVALLGRDIEESEFGEPVFLLERNFGVHHEVADHGELRLGGGDDARFVGQAMSPEYFLVVEDGMPFGEANLAVLFTSLETAQNLNGTPSAVNDLVLTVRDDAEMAEVETALASELTEAYPQTRAVYMTRDQDASYRAMTEDAEGDQQIFIIFAVVLFGGAAFATLNFTARIVETQRREIGISMALGATPASIAARPILVGSQIAVLGVVFGIAVGWLAMKSMTGVVEQFLVLPVMSTPFEYGAFIRFAAAGFFIPLLAVLWPVVRAVRVQPVQAIKSGHLASRGGGMAHLLTKLPIPGNTITRMPFNNFVRSPRRTALTMFSLAAIIALLIATIGTRDSVNATFILGGEEIRGDATERLAVNLDDIYPVDSDTVARIMSNDALQAAESIIYLPVSARKQAFDEVGQPSISAMSSPEDLAVHETEAGSGALILHFIDFDSPYWRPTAVEGEIGTGDPGIVLSRKGAKDIGVKTGDEVYLTHARRNEDGTFGIDTTSMRVVAIHAYPLRSYAYADTSQLTALGLAGYTNSITGSPAAGSSLNDVKRALFDTPGVATVQGLNETFDAISSFLDQVSSIYLVVEVAVICIAMLIAFNTANINIDERARDHATMFSFGIPTGRILFNLAIEGMLLGAMASVLGFVLGLGLLWWIISTLVPNSYPEIGVAMRFDVVRTIVFLLITIAAVAVAPTLTVRKLRRMDIPSTLRVQE